MKATFAFEFLSRGLMWSRLLLIALLVPDDHYALVVLLVTAEALIGELIAYPQIRHVLTSRDIGVGPVWSGLMFWAVTLPVQYGASFYYFHSHVVALIVVTCSLLFSLHQVLIYTLRVISVRDHNIAKFAASVLSTTAFFLLIPIHPYLYLVAALVAPVTPVFLLLRKEGSSFFRAAFPRLRELWSSWANFGMQALSAVVWQHGNRLVVGFLFAASVLSSFTRGYLLSSGVIFIYSAAMIVWEREISVEIDDMRLRERVRKAAVVFGFMAGFWVLYSAAVLLAFIHPVREIPYISALGAGVDGFVFIIFLLLFLVRALQLVVSPVVIAMGQKEVVTIASTASLAVQVLGFSLFWRHLTPLHVALAMLASIVIAVLITGTAVVLGLRVEERRRRIDALVHPRGGRD